MVKLLDEMSPETGEAAQMESLSVLWAFDMPGTRHVDMSTVLLCFLRVESGAAVCVCVCVCVKCR